MPVTLEDVACPLGCPRGEKAILSGRDLLHNLPGEFTVVKCSTCGLMRTNPRPTAASIGFYYPDDYGPYQGTRVTPGKLKQRSLLKRILKPVFACLFRFNTEILPAMKPGRLLEIGCASGSFLHSMAAKGWLVEGIEFSDKAAQDAASFGYQVYSGALETSPQPEHPYDLIVGWMVLEHLHKPVESLKKLYERSRPSAALVLSMPNTCSLEFKILKNRWFALQLPTHLYHFTPDSLDQVLLAAGWKVEKIFHQRALSNLTASLGFILRERGMTGLGRWLSELYEKPGVWPFLLYPVAYILSIFGQTGRMTVWARKV